MQIRPPVLLPERLETNLQLMSKHDREGWKESEEELFRLLVENIADYAIFVVDVERRVLSWNGGAERLLGYAEREIIGQSADVVFTPEDRQAGVPEREVAEALAAGRGDDDRWHVRKDGSRFWAGGRMTPLRDESGELRGFAKIMRDRTEWKRQQEAAEERLRIAGLNRDVGLALIEAQQLVDMLRQCADAIVQHLPGVAVGIWVVTTDSNALHLSATAAAEAGMDWPERISLERSTVEQVAQELQGQSTVNRHGFAGFPLIVDGTPVGLLAIQSPEAFNRPLLDALDSLANGIALGIERKVAENEVRQQREWLRVTLASIGDAVIATDTEGRVTYLNDVARHLTGWSSDDARGQPLETVFQILHEETGDVVENPAAKVLREGRIVGLGNHTVLVSRTGEVRPIDDSAAPIRGSSGELQGVVLVFRDVTDERAKQQSLQQSESRKAAILETALDCIITMDHEGRIVEFNPAAERTFGYTRAAAVGQRLAELIIPETYREPHYRGLAHYLATGEGPVLGRRLELSALRSDGSEFPVELAIARTSPEDPPLFTAYLRDISARRILERQRSARLAVTQSLAQSTSELDGVSGVLSAICEHLGWQLGFYWEVDPQQEVLRCRQSWHRADSVETDFERTSCRRTFEKGDGLPGRIWFSRAPMWIRDVTQDNNFPRARTAAEVGLHSAFACPVAVDGDFIGVIEFFTQSLREADEDLLEMMSTVAGNLGQFIERRRAEEELKEQTATAETLNRIGRLLAEELDLHNIVQVVTDEGTRLSGAQFGAFFYNVVGERGEAYTLYTLSGAPRSAFDNFPMPRNTDLFGPTFRGEGVVRLDDVTQDPRFGQNAPYHGLPSGHLPVRSYLAVPVVSSAGEVLGGLFFGHADVGVFTAASERLLAGVAGQAAVAIDNARLYEAQRSSAERLNLALAAADLGDWSWDTASDVVTLSDRAAAIVGVTAGGRLTWTGLQTRIHEEDRPSVTHEVRRVLDEQAQFDIEFRVNRPDGRQVWVGVLGRGHHTEGRPQGMFGVMQDITERKRLEDSLRASEGRFRGLMEQAPFSIQVFSPTGSTVTANRAWEELWGVRLDELGDYNILEDRQLAERGVLHHIQRAFAGEPAHVPAIEYDPNATIPDRTRHDDPVRWVGAVAYPLKDDAGNVREVVLVHEDVTARRRAEAALRESEEKLRLLADTIPQLAWMARPDGHIFWYNRRWYEYTGTTPEQMEGWGWRSVHDPEALPSVIERWRHSLETGTPFDMVFPLRGADGVFRPFLTRVNPLRHEQDGEILYWFGTNTDITELRETREALVDSEERLRLALDAGRMGVWDWNIRTGGLRWSDSLEPLHGLEPGTFGGTFEHFQELIHPADRDAVNNAIREAVASGDDFQVEFRNIRPDRSVHWIAGFGRVFAGDDGAPARMIGIGMDITDHKRAEQRSRFLADASAALAVLVDFDSTLQKVASLAVPDFADWATVDLLDADGTLRRVAVSHVDPTKVQLAHELHGRFPPDPDAPQGLWHILRTGRPEHIIEITDDLLQQSIPDAEYLQIIRDLGLRSYIGVPLTVRGRTLGVITFISAESGLLYETGDLAVAQDLANRASISIENSQLYKELREADRRKDEFLATLAHELRNPLAPIRNGLQVLRLAGADESTAEQARTMMDRQLTQMVRLVDDLLDVSRITRNKLELRRERVPLATIVHSATETSRPLVEQGGHTLSVRLPPDLVYLDADPVRLAQVFSNLLNNSARYTEPGGRIELTAESNTDHVLIRVRDNGRGIPRAELERVFEMFAQVEGDRTQTQGGLGIGLTLVRRLVEMHGGSVGVHSDGLGLGSEFTVRLPTVADQQGRTLSTEASASRTKAVGRRILVVDDNPDSARSLGMLLKLLGNEIRTAGDGLEAIQAAEEFRPELILLDIGLPKLDGYEACRRIRQQPWSKPMTIVALTGWGQQEDRRRSQEAGFDHHLVKPVDLPTLRQLLSER